MKGVSQNVFLVHKTYINIQAYNQANMKHMLKKKDDVNVRQLIENNANMYDFMKPLVLQVLLFYVFFLNNQPEQLLSSVKQVRTEFSALHLSSTS